MITKSKFKVGDRVRLLPGIFEDYADNPVWGGKFGKILGIIDKSDYWDGDVDDFNIHVQWDNGTNNPYPECILEKEIGDWEV